MIVILDYGMGNVNSILNMLKKIGVDSKISGNSDEIEEADKIILPGVGSFDMGMSRLNETGLISAIQKHALVKKKPVLGICLGMQMLGRRSEEGKLDGLSLIPFDNIKFDFPNSNNLKIPHMGWDIISETKSNSPLLYELKDDQRYYFVHSYHAVCDKPDNIIMRCDYGHEFAAGVVNENIYGVQFHPEKSHKFGMALLDNFSKRC